MKKRIIYVTVLMFSMLIFTGCVASSPVVSAAKNNNFKMMKQEIDKGSKVDEVDEKGITALMYAAKSADLATVEYLVQKGASINAKSKSLWTPLHYAVRYNSFDVVKYLLKNGADLNAESSEKVTPIYLSIYRENESLKEQISVIKFLLEKGADVNIAAKNNWTPLLIASREKPLEIVKFLINNKANINDTTSDRWTALHLAARYNSADVVEYLVKQGVDLDVQILDKGIPNHTPLYLALYREKERLNDKIRVIDCLLKNGANANIKGKSDWTAFLDAAQNTSLDIVKLFIKHKADINSKTVDNWNPLHLAARYNSLDVVKYLVQNGVDLNAQTLHKGKAHNTPLILTIYREKEQLKDQEAIIKFLLEHGANPNIKTSDNKTILHFTARNSSLNIVKSLVENNADINAAQPDGWEPLHLAARYNNIDVVKYLANNGADLNAQTVYKGKINYTPLHLALYREKEEIKDQEAIVKYLIGMDTNLMLKDSYGRTAQIVATQSNQYKLLKYFKDPSLAKREVEEDKKKQQRIIVNEFINNKDFQGLKTYTDKNPSAAYYISDDSLRLMFTGPRGMKVGDIRKLLKQGKSEVIVISLIKRVKTPYKEFTLDEIDTLIEMGLSDNIIASMIDVTTELLKDEQRKKEQQFLLSEQQRIAKENSKTKVIYQQGPSLQQKTVGDVIIDKAVDKAVDKGVEMLLRKLF
ncbi:ankyrin repeat domain-containing protein [Sulfurimonas sp.]|uniref:ankyrin repeat domain-containing protein n=1 Tax=Sulfurimonas sp. TaxID=2022749 RepID=UPI0035673700